MQDQTCTSLNSQHICAKLQGVSCVHVVYYRAELAHPTQGDQLGQTRGKTERSELDPASPNSWEQCTASPGHTSSWQGKAHLKPSPRWCRCRSRPGQPAPPASPAPSRRPGFRPTAFQRPAESHPEHLSAPYFNKFLNKCARKMWWEAQREILELCRLLC